MSLPWVLMRRSRRPSWTEGRCFVEAQSCKVTSTDVQLDGAYSRCVPFFLRMQKSMTLIASWRSCLVLSRPRGVRVHCCIIQLVGNTSDTLPFQSLLAAIICKLGTLVTIFLITNKKLLENQAAAKNSILPHCPPPPPPPVTIPCGTHNWGYLWLKYCNRNLQWMSFYRLPPWSQIYFGFR